MSQNVKEKVLMEIFKRRYLAGELTSYEYQRHCDRIKANKTGRLDQHWSQAQ